jgi:hypothetical protein
MLDTSKAVTFSSPMPTANYRVALESSQQMSASLWVTNKTASGFTVNVSAAMSATLGYTAVADT